jgi:hypothetical protein
MGVCRTPAWHLRQDAPVQRQMIRLLDQGADQAYRMIFRDQLVQTAGAPSDLQAVGAFHPRPTSQLLALNGAFLQRHLERGLLYR